MTSRGGPTWQPRHAVGWGGMNPLWVYFHIGYRILDIYFFLSLSLSFFLSLSLFIYMAVSVFAAPYFALNATQGKKHRIGAINDLVHQIRQLPAKMGIDSVHTLWGPGFPTLFISYTNTYRMLRMENICSLPSSNFVSKPTSPNASGAT